MTPINPDPRASAVLGQKYAFATASLILGICCFVNILGLEKGLLAILFAWLALKSDPAPALSERRGWAQAGLVLGAILLVVVPTVLLLNLGRVKTVIDALMKLQNAK